MAVAAILAGVPTSMGVTMLLRAAKSAPPSEFASLGQTTAVISAGKG